MKHTKRILGAAVVLVAASAIVAAVQAKTSVKMPIVDPKPIYLEAQLAPAFGTAAYGHATYQAKVAGESYRFDAEILVPKSAFKDFGIDPEDGFEDETVIAIVGKYAFKLQFGANEPEGVRFTTTDFGDGLVIAEGDEVKVEVNAKEAVAGKF